MTRPSPLQVSGDPVKLGLGLASMGFDMIFMAQHWICYHATDALVCTPADYQDVGGASDSHPVAAEALAESCTASNSAVSSGGLQAIATLVAVSPSGSAQQLRSPLLPVPTG